MRANDDGGNSDLYAFLWKGKGEIDAIMKEAKKDTKTNSNIITQNNTKQKIQYYQNKTINSGKQFYVVYYLATSNMQHRHQFYEDQIVSSYIQCSLFFQIQRCP